MRFSIATVLLVATAIAAPVQNLDKRAGRVDQHESLTVRGILSLLPRFPALAPPLKPAPKPVPKPGPHDSDPAPAPLRPGTDAPAAKPNQVGACGLKRTPKCNPQPGSDLELAIDQNYQRKWEIARTPTAKYLNGYTKKGDEWGRITTKNNDDLKNIEDIWVDDMVKNQNFNKQEAKNVVEDELAELPRGVMVVEASYKYDLHRPFSGKTDKGKEWTRPAINPEAEVQWKKHVMDNLRVAAARQNGNVKDLRHIGRDNIETEDVQVLLKNLLGTDTKKTFTAADNPNEFAQIGETLHGKTTHALLRDNKKEPGKLEVKQYTVSYDKETDRLDMMIDVAP